MNIAENNISTWVPVEFVKGGDGKAQKMKVGGLASTISKDTDGEYLDPNGFDVSYFLNSGFLNWDHQAKKDPSSIIGRPTKAVITERGLEIEGELFDSEKARQVYDLAHTLKKAGLSLGFSIEGKALMRGSMDKDHPDWKKVTKAMITGCAITPNPKNSDTVAEIIKGNEYFALSAYSEEDEESVEKAMMAGSASGQAIAKESLRDEVVNLEYSDCDAKNLANRLTKGETYNLIFKRYPKMDAESATRIVKLVETIEKTDNMKHKGTDENIGSFSEESFQKALDVIDGLGTGKTEPKKEDVEVTDQPKKEESKKGDVEEQEEKSEDEDEIEKSISDEQLEAARVVASAAGYTLVKADEIEKSTTGEEDLSKENDSNIAELIKGLGTDLEKGIDDKFGEALGAIPHLGTLVKGLAHKYNSMQDTLDKILENEPPAKSVQTATAIEKSFDSDLEKGGHGQNTLSVSGQKQVILGILEKGYLSADGQQITNHALAKDAMIFESSSQLSKGIVDELTGKGYTITQ